MQTTYVVKGMTCGHCAGAVTQEVSRLPGVEHVEVDVAGGRAVVTSVDALELDTVRAAVDEAGYELVGVSE